MGKSEKQIFFLTISPTLIMGLFLLSIIRDNPNTTQFLLATSVLIALLIVAAITHLKIRKSYIDPLTHLNMQLEEPSLNLDPISLTSDSQIQRIAFTLQQQFQYLKLSHQDQLNRVNKENTSLRYNLKHMKEAKNNAISTLAVLNREIKADKFYKKILLELLEIPLEIFISLNDLLHQTEDPSLKFDISRAASHFVFYGYELENFTHHEKASHISIFETIDDVLLLLESYSRKSGYEVLPIFEGNCNLKPHLKRQLVKICLFNFILTQLQAQPKVAATRDGEKTLQTCLLTIDTSSLGSLNFSFSALTKKTESHHNRRLHEVLKLLNGEIHNSEMDIPFDTSNVLSSKNLNDLNGPSTKFENLKAVLIAENNFLNRSINSRLASIGIDVIDINNSTEADFSLIALSQHNNIVKMKNSLNKNLPTVLINNTIQYHTDFGFQLSLPLQHQALLKILNHINVKQKDNLGLARPIFDEALALKRANNHKELVTEFLQLLMESLTADIAALVEACHVGDILHARKLLHKMSGALYYSGTIGLSNSIEAFADVISGNPNLEKTSSVALLNEVVSDHHALEVWYNERIAAQA